MALLSVGTVGGIIIFWDRNWIGVLNSMVELFSDSLKCRVRGNDLVWILFGVY